MMLNCFKCKLIPPPDFIPYNCRPYEYKDEIWVDACLAEEISDLWSKGIRTLGCCCGHGTNNGFIQVIDDDIVKMEELGHEHYIYPNDKDRLDAFIRKSKNHYYYGYTDCYLG